VIGTKDDKKLNYRRESAHLTLLYRTVALSYVGHVNNTGKDRSMATVNGEQDLYCTGASRQCTRSR